MVKNNGNSEGFGENDEGKETTPIGQTATAFPGETKEEEDVDIYATILSSSLKKTRQIETDSSDGLTQQVDRHVVDGQEGDTPEVDVEEVDCDVTGNEAAVARYSEEMRIPVYDNISQKSSSLM